MEGTTPSKSVTQDETTIPTFEELWNELFEYFFDYKDYFYKGKNKDSEIGIQIKKAEEFLNEENFERELEELTESTSALSIDIGDSRIVDLDMSNF
ncbi:hypothetical protein Glove_91g9 [Diversispora epigaea]|uniref:Uncharacterized protein n=1 Tax=Diversispora epigaea TaxID=1348612 RepID=A0A397JEC3_9GLOM|nr:hypothetical protein Glove_91g9 [Diversispora epigaea]